MEVCFVARRNESQPAGMLCLTSCFCMRPGIVSPVRLATSNCTAGRQKACPVTSKQAGMETSCVCCRLALFSATRLGPVGALQKKDGPWWDAGVQPESQRLTLLDPFNSLQIASKTPHHVILQSTSNTRGFACTSFCVGNMKVL